MRHNLGWRNNPGLMASALVLLAACLLLLGSSIDSHGVQNFQPLWGDPQTWKIVWEIRLPRTLGTWLAGALLGMAGAIAQGLFRNPLADPYLLGSASGAALGVAIGLTLMGGVQGHWLASGWTVQLGLSGSAFLGALAAVLLTLVLARGVHHTLRLVLAGVVVGAVLGALVSLIMLLRPELMLTLQAYVLGSSAFVDWPACALMAVVLVLCLLVGLICSRVLDALGLGEATALSLGMPLAGLRLVLVAVLSLASASAVAQTGLIGFVGLVAPHLVRSVLKVTHAWLVLLSCLAGGLLLMAADILARSLFAPLELPVGVLTAVLGGAYLLWLMHRQSPAGIRP